MEVITIEVYLPAAPFLQVVLAIMTGMVVFAVIRGILNIIT